MDKDELEFHASEMLKNPLFEIIMAKLERDAVDRGVNAKATDHEAHQSAMADVRAARTFRRECEAILRNKPALKAGFA